MPGLDTMSDASLPLDHPPGLLAGVLPPYSALAAWRTQIRLLALVFCGMPFCCDLWEMPSQGLARTDFVTSAVRAATSLNCPAMDCSPPLPGVGAAWGIMLASLADPHSHLPAARSHLIQVNVRSWSGAAPQPDLCEC
jgi:hypothetical protein